MFPRTESTQKKQQPIAKDESVRKENQLEEDQNSVQPMGNEAANVELMNQMLREANDDNELDLSGYEDQEVVEVPFNGGNRGPEGGSGAIDLNNSMYLNSSHNIVNDEWLDRVKSGKEKNVPGIAPKEPEKKKDEKHPPQEDVKAALDIAEEIVKDQPQQAPKKEEEEDFPPLSTYEIEEDLAANTGRKKKKKKGKKSSKANEIPERQLGGMEGLHKDARWKAAAAKRIKKVELANPAEQEAFHAEEMERLKNWDFNAQKLDKIKKTSKWKRFLIYTAAGMGKLLSTAFQVLTLGHFWRLKSTARFAFTNTNKWQTTKDYRNIPGWDGAKFSPAATRGEDVMADFRRVPTVWSRLTAAKAAEPVQKDGKEEEKPLDPVVSVLVEQPKSGSAQAMDGGEMGHTMIGIEYSRKSAISGRYERYKVQYGFYPAGSTTNLSGGMMMLRHNAIMPGQLSDDYSHKYDVSRRYPASPKQVNAIFQASEKYAEGGYGYYDRNCSTFVKEMVVNTAHLATGGEIFKQSEVGFSHFANFGMFGAEAFEQNARAGAETTLMDLAKKNDLSYQNYSNKRATARDWVNYKNSIKKSSGLTKETFVPGEIGEQLRRMDGDQAGEIGSYKYDAPLKDENGDVIVGLRKISGAIERCGTAIQEHFEELIPPEEMGQAPYEVATIANTLAGMGAPLDNLDSDIDAKLTEENEGKSDDKIAKRENIKEYYYVTPDALRKARSDLSDNISKVNILLNNYFKNDNRLHQPLMELISLLNHGINYVDDLYQNSARGGLSKKGDVKNIRDEMTHNVYTIRAGGNETTFTPTHYESYIQIYKDPKIAVAKYARLKDLRKKKKEAGSWTGSKLSILKHKVQSVVNAEDENLLTMAERDELSKLERLESLACEFDKSHNYMLEKDSYSQQDIDYAFRMHDKELNGLQTNEEVDNDQDDVNKDIRDNYKSASGIYITIFMEKFFKDLKDQWMKGKDEGGLSEDVANVPEIAGAWLDDYLTKRIKQKEKGFLMVVRGLYRSMKAADPNNEVTAEALLEKLDEIITQTIISRNFVSVGGEVKELYGGIFLPMALDRMVANRRMKFHQLVAAMLRICEMEEKDKELTKKS